MRRRVPHIPQRVRIFVGCEGESEAGYVQLIDGFARDADIAVHLHAEVLAPHAGDPLSRVQRSVSRLAHLASRRGQFRHRFILMDEDQVVHDLGRADQARRLAEREDIHIIWQGPCHEALLLRHLPAHHDRRPPDTQTAERALVQAWPEYQKPFSRPQLSARIDLAGLYRAALVEPQLALLLRTIGLTAFEDN